VGQAENRNFHSQLLNEKTSQDEYRELRLINIEKNLKKTEQKLMKTTKKLKITVSKINKKTPRGPISQSQWHPHLQDSDIKQKSNNGRP
jgi:hypothetical protein